MIDPKISFWLNIAISVLSAIVGATAQLSTIFGTSRAQAVISICALVLTIVTAINGALHGYSAPTAGPMVKTS